MRKSLALSAAIVALAAAGAARAETLAEAVAHAYATNPGVAAQRAALRALDESWVQARAGFGPTVTATAGETYQGIDRDGDVLEAGTESQSLVLNQPVFTGGRLTARLDAARAQIEAGRENLRRAEIELVQRVVAAYAGVRRDQRVLAIAEESVQVLERHLADTQKKFDVRQVTRTDVEQARARLASARTQATSARGQLGQARAAYAAVVGRLPLDLQPEPALDGLPPTLDAAFDLADANSPVVRAAQFTERASRARVAQARADRRPSVSVRVSAENGPALPYQERPTQGALTGSVAVSQPLWSGGQTGSAVRQALEENNRDRLLAEEAGRALIQNLASSWEQLVAAREALATLQEEARANTVAAAGVRAEERFALRTSLEILNAEAELRAAQVNLARGRYNEYLGRVQVLAVTGVLSPRIFAPEVELYDAERNFDRVDGKGALPWEPALRAVDRLAKPPGPRPAPVDSGPARPAGAPLPPLPAS